MRGPCSGCDERRPARDCPRIPCPLARHGRRADVLSKALECYWEVLSSPALPWSGLMEVEVEELLCTLAEERMASQAG